MIAAMASSSQDERNQAKERRYHQQARYDMAWHDPPHLEHDESQSNLFGPPQRRVHDDQTALRIKKVFGSRSPPHYPTPPSHLTSPSPHLSKPSYKPSSKPSTYTNHEKNDSHHSHSSHSQPSTSEPDVKESKRSKKSDNPGNEHKSKHKEKKKKSHSDEKPKKSKSHDKAKVSSKNAPPVTAPSVVPAKPSLGIKHRHRSPSVCSDRSDQSSRSTKATSSDHAKHITGHHQHEQNAGKSKSKSSNNRASLSPLPPGHNHLHNANSAKGAQTKSSMVREIQNSDASADPTKNHSKISSSSNMSVKPSTTTTIKQANRQPINGFSDKSKPTNLVMPTTTTTHKGSTDVMSILYKMTRNDHQMLTGIQTPIKPDMPDPFSFRPHKPIEPISDDDKKLEPTPKLYNDAKDNCKATAVPADTSLDKAPFQPAPVQSAPVQPAPVQPAPVQPAPTQPQINGLAELQMSSDSDSESSSSSSSSSSSGSSSSDSSDSDSDSSESDKEEQKKPLFPHLVRSPALQKPQQEPVNNNDWSLDKFIISSPAKPPAHTEPVVSSRVAPSHHAATKPAVNSNRNGSAPKKRGRPPKSKEKDPDPDFYPPTSQPETIPSIVVNSKSKRQPPSKTKNEPSKKRGRPNKKDESVKSLAMSSDESSLTSKPSPTRPEITSTISSSSGGVWDSVPDLVTDGLNDNEEDEDVDVVNNESPTAGSTAAILNVGSRHEFKNLSQEPISPIDPSGPLASQLSGPLTSSLTSIADEKSCQSLVISIPLSRLRRCPGVKREPHSAPRDICSMSSLPVKPGQPPNKRKISVKDLVNSKKIKAETKSEESSLPPSQVPVTDSKDMMRQMPAYPVPSYDNPQVYHEKARSLKQQFVKIEARPMRNIAVLESILNFMMSAIGREQKDHKAFTEIKDYYMTTLQLAESIFSDVFRDHNINISDISIQRCCQVLCSLVLAHLSCKVYKLYKERASASLKRIEEHLRDAKAAISPHSHPSLPGTGINSNKNRGSPCSPAPSPASITSTGSLTSDSGRNPSISSSQTSVPDHIIKDHENYIFCMKKLSSAYDTWQTSMVRVQTEHKEFFRRLEDDLGYSIDMHTDSRQFVHFIYTGCIRLKNKLSSPTPPPCL